MDLLACFGSEHPVLVDGSALCRRVGGNDAVDWSHGGQWLQCIYIAERILAGLVAKGLQLHVFFFSEEMAFLPVRQRLLWLLLSEHLRRAKVPKVTHHLLEGGGLGFRVSRNLWGAGVRRCKNVWQVGSAKGAS